MNFQHRWAGPVLMHRIARYILGAVLLIPAVSSQAATLVIGDVLSFTSAAGSSAFGTVVLNGNPASYNSASLDSLNGIIIGTAQPTVPDIDQTWFDTLLNSPGNHYTNSAVNVLSSTTLDFSGWGMYFGVPYDFGATQGIATYSYNGSNYTLDYSWNANTDNGGVLLGGVISTYNLHLVGAVSSVPIPGAIWLFGSGIAGLIGFARRRSA